MNDRHEFRARAEEPLELVQLQLSRVVDRNDTQARARLFAQQLPGNNVGVMLHFGDHDLITGPYMLPAVRLRYQVDTLGRVTGEDNFSRLGRMHELLHP